MSKPDQFPQPQAIQGEIIPNKFLERGDMRTIDAEIDYIQTSYQTRKKWNEEHGGWEKEPTDEIESLRAMQKEGFEYILRLPRVNVVACVKKYGPVYDKLKRYFEFIDGLARRNGITRFKHTTDSYYVFDTKKDAELLKQKLIEKQGEAKLEFEIIEGSQPPPIADQTDTGR